MVLPGAQKGQNTDSQAWPVSATHPSLHIEIESGMRLTLRHLPHHRNHSWNKWDIFKGKLLDMNLPLLENMILGKTELQFALENKRTNTPHPL